MTEKKFRNTPKGRIAPNGYRLCDTLPEGQILIDREKKQWITGKTIGLGGFGEIYIIYEKDCPTKEYVMKLDNTNGPLFVEVNFVLRACQQSTIDAFMAKHKLSFLGIPKFIASGTHQAANGGYRFLIMDKLGEELQKVLETRRLTIPTTCRIACRIIDALEFIHDQGYIHADIKAQNILRSPENSKNRKKRAIDNDIYNDDHYYLIDYGLVEKYTLQGIHKPYEMDKRKANNGTCEFRSRDAHIGVISRRSDIESLGFNLILWFYGHHPWKDVLKDANKVLERKNWAMDNITDFLNESFSEKQTYLENDTNSAGKGSRTKNSKISKVVNNKIIPPKGLSDFFEEIKTMSHDVRPNYEKYKKILENIGRLNPAPTVSNGSPKKMRSLNNNSSNTSIDNNNTTTNNSIKNNVKIKRMNKKSTKVEKKSPNNTATNSLNGNLTDDDTEIEDEIIPTSVVKSRTKKVKSPLTTSKTNRMTKAKNSKIQVNLRNRKPMIKKEIDNDTDDSKDANDCVDNGKSKMNSSLSTPIMIMTPPRYSGHGPPLFGPFEEEDIIRHSRRIKNKILQPANNTDNEINDENANVNRQSNFRMYIGNKRCEPQPDNENNFNNVNMHKMPSTLTESTESRSTRSTASSRKVKVNNASKILTSTPIPTQSNGISTPETPAMQSIRMKMQNKSDSSLLEYNHYNNLKLSNSKSSSNASKQNNYPLYTENEEKTNGVIPGDRNNVNNSINKTPLDDKMIRAAATRKNKLARIRPLIKTAGALSSSVSQLKTKSISDTVIETAAMQSIRLKILNKKKQK